MIDVYKKLSNAKEVKTVIQEFEKLGRETLSTNASKIEQDAGLLKAYEKWIKLNDFQKEFCDSIIELSNKVFSDNAIELPSWAISALKKQEDLQHIYQISHNINNQRKDTLNYLYEKNKDEFLSDKFIVQILDRDEKANTQSLSKFNYGLKHLYKGTFEKSKIHGFKTTVTRLCERIVRNIEQYEFKLKVFKDKPREAYASLKLLNQLFCTWYLKKNKIQNTDKCELQIYNEFIKENFASTLEESDDKAISRSLESLITYLQTGVDTSIQLTKINQGFLGILGKKAPYSTVNSQYLVQLWSENASRQNALAIPSLNQMYFKPIDINACLALRRELLEKNSKLMEFLNNSLIDCVIRIQNSIFDKTSQDQLLSIVVNESGIGLTEFEKNISVHIKKFEKTNKLTIKELLTLSDYNDSLEHGKYFKNLCFIHLLVLKVTNETQEFEELIEQSFKHEISCLYHSVFLCYSFTKVFGDEFKENIVAKYRAFKKEVFSFAKVWLLILNKELINNVNVNEFISKNLRKLFQCRLSISNKSLQEGIINKEVKALCKEFSINPTNIKLFPFQEVLSEGFDDYENFNYFTKKNDNEFEVTEIIYYLHNELLHKYWVEAVGKYDEDILFHAYISDFLNNTSLSYTELIGADRNYLKNVVRGKYFDEYIKSITNKSFNNIFLGFDESMSVSLNQKLNVVSNLLHLGDDRFKLLTDENHNSIKLGQGGFGCVYKAHDTLLDSTVAIKLIPRWHDSPELEKQMLKEASIMRKCQHKNVVTVYDVYKFSTNQFVFKNSVPRNVTQQFQVDEYCYGIVMELISDGQTLNTYLESSQWGKATFNEKIDFFTKICEGVTEIHSLDKVHGDLKPQNILVDENGIPKVTDFGLTRNNGEFSVGKSVDAFISVNQLKGQASGKEDDLYSLGMIYLYIFVPNVIREFEVESLSELIYRKELLHITLLSLKTHFGDSLKSGFIHRYFFPDDEFVEDPIAKHSLFKKVIDEYTKVIKASEFDSRVLEKSFEYLSKSLTTEEEQKEIKFVQLLDELNISRKSRCDLELLEKEYISQGANFSNIYESTEFIRALKGDFAIVGNITTVFTPLFNGEALTYSKILDLSKSLSFEELIKLSASDPDTVEYVLSGTVDVDQTIIIWKINDCYYHSHLGKSQYFGDAFEKSKFLYLMKKTYANYFELIHSLESNQHSDTFCLAELAKIPFEMKYFIAPFTPHKPIMKGGGVFELPRGLIKNSYLLEKLIDANKIYNEVLKGYLDGEIYKPFEILDSDHAAEILSSGEVDSGIPNEFTGNIINFETQRIESELLREIKSKDLINNIWEFIKSDQDKSFNSFLTYCFNYQDIKKSIISWRNSDDTKLFKRYRELKLWSDNSPEYELVMKFMSRDTNQKITILTQ